MILRLPCTGILWLLSLTALTPGIASVTRVACVGNSITYGAGIPGRETHCYPARLQSLLGDGYLVENFGKNGATLLSSGDIPYVRQREFGNALSFLPAIVFIELGTNDSKPRNRAHLQEFERDYTALIDSFRTLVTAPRIVLLLPPPVFTKDSSDITGDVISQRILPIIRAAAYDRGCEVVDLHTLFLETPDLFPDQVHPSARGAEMMATRLSEFLTMEADTGYSLSARLHREGIHTNYYGFDCFTFPFEGREAKVVFPRTTSKGRPWIWRARFWGHEPQTEIALLERGFHVVYCDVAELFGNNEAIGIWERFYGLITDGGLSPRSALEGFSRGGIYVYRWASIHPDRVTCVYADAPVLDIKSWPGGKGKSRGNPEEWERFKKDFCFTSDAEAIAFKGNPLDLAPRIAGAGFPMLHVCGEADETVPIDENTNPFEKSIRANHGDITVIRKPGIGHHPHSLADPRPIVDFILHATATRGIAP